MDHKKYSLKSSANSKVQPLCEKMSRLLLDPTFSDVTIDCDGQSFPCHRSILALSSPVFSAMFSHSETTECTTKTVRVEDMSAAAMEAFLAFLYTSSVEGLKKHAKELAMAAEKYQIDELKMLALNEMDRSSWSKDSVRHQVSEPYRRIARMM